MEDVSGDAHVIIWDEVNYLTILFHLSSRLAGNTNAWQVPRAALGSSIQNLDRVEAIFIRNRCSSWSTMV